MRLLQKPSTKGARSIPPPEASMIRAEQCLAVSVNLGAVVADISSAVKGWRPRHPERMPTKVDGPETIHNVGNYETFYPPGGDAPVLRQAGCPPPRNDGAMRQCQYALLLCAPTKRRVS